MPPTDPHDDPRASPLEADEETLDWQEADTMRLPAAGPSPAPDLPQLEGYEVIGRLGQGGMGAVFEARQLQPRRRVAVKVIHRSVVDEVSVRMFRREAASMALLKHPGIGAIYESGVTADLQHFIVLELVEGVDLARWLRTRGPVTTEEELEVRLEVFCQIAAAVHYAHQRGVIHRDLKPANIIVQERDTVSASSRLSSNSFQPKILDFGLARITEGDAADATTRSEIGVIKGTLQYMSPEQATGDPAAIDLRSDVYALGVILYEMIASKRPYDFGRVPLVEAVRVIRDSTPENLDRATPGLRLDPDLNTIVSKALAKEADGRYASAAEFETDVRRFMLSMPILARPPSVSYQLRKFMARNKGLTGGVAAAFVMLLLGIAGTSVGMLRAQEQRRLAEQEQLAAEQVTELLFRSLSGYDLASMAEGLRQDFEQELAQQGDLPGSIDHGRIAIGLLRRETFDRLAAAVAQRGEGPDAVSSRIHDALSNAYLELGAHEESLKHSRFSMAFLDREPDNYWQPRMVNQLVTARSLTGLGRYEEAVLAFREAIEILERAQRRGPLPNETGLLLETYSGQNFEYRLDLARELCGVLARLQRHEEIEREIAAAMAFSDGVIDRSDVRWTRLEFRLAWVATQQGRHEAAREVLSGLVERLRTDDPRWASAVSSLASGFAATNETERAFEALEQLVAHFPGDVEGWLADPAFDSLRGDRFDALSNAPRRGHVGASPDD